MAYGAIKYGEFTDDFGQDWKVEILKEGYTGSSASFKLGSDGFKLKYKGEGDEITAGIKGSELTFTFYSESAADDTFIINIANANPNDHAVRVYKDTAGANTVYWVGLIQMDSAEIVDDYYPQPYTLRATDGLSNLPNLIMTDLTSILNVETGATENFQAMTPGGPVWTGAKYQHISMIVRALTLPPTSELWGSSATFLRSTFNWNEASMNNLNQDPLRYTATASDYWYSINNDGTFRYFTLKNLITEILKSFNARLFLAEGEWKLVQVNAYKHMPTTAQRYARYNKAGTQIGSGPHTEIISEITAASSPFRKANIVSRYSAPIKQIKTKVELETAYGATAQASSWSTHTEYTLNGDDSPVVADYTNTYHAAGEANNGYTFQLKIKPRLTSVLSDPGNYPSIGGSSYVFYVEIRAFIKCGSQYLYWDNQQNKYRWSASATPVYPLYTNGIYSPTPHAWVPFYTNNLGLGTITYGSTTTALMEQCPNTDPIEFYAYYRINAANQFDATSSFAAGDHVVKLQSNYSSSANCSIFQNGALTNETFTTVTNSPGGTTIDGGITIEDTVMLNNNNTISSLSEILVWDGSGYGYPANWKIGQVNWKNTNTTMTAVDLIAMRGIDRVAMQNTATEIIQGDILRTIQQSTLEVCDFYKAIEYNGDIYVPNGLTFNAREGRTQGEWQKINYDVTVAQNSNDVISLLSELFEDWDGSAVNWWW